MQPCRAVRRSRFHRDAHPPASTLLFLAQSLKGLSSMVGKILISAVGADIMPAGWIFLQTPSTGRTNQGDEFFHLWRLEVFNRITTLIGFNLFQTGLLVRLKQTRPRTLFPPARSPRRTFLELVDPKLQPMVAQCAPHKRMVMRVGNQLTVCVHHPRILRDVLRGEHILHIPEYLLQYPDRNKFSAHKSPPLISLKLTSHPQCLLQPMPFPLP